MSEFPETSHSLIARVKDLADGSAWAEFLGIYQPVVYRMARRRGLQDADAQDVAQQVFVAVARAIREWQPEPGMPPFRAWLVTITRNAVTKALVRRRPDTGRGGSSVGELLILARSNESTDSADEFSRESRLAALQWAAEQIRPEFSPMTWRLFWDSAVLGRSIAELSRDAGRSAGAIYMARFKVLQRLKAKMLEVTQGLEALPENDS